MRDPIFDTNIEYLKGVGPQRAEVLKKELRIFTFRDLLQHFPFRYVDKSRIYSIRQAKEVDMPLQIKAKILHVEEHGSGRKKRLSAMIEDETGRMELVWFRGIKWVKPNLTPGKTYLFYGKVSQFNGKYNIAHPDLQEYNPNQPMGGLQPIYHSTEKCAAKGLHSKGIEKIINELLPQINGRIMDVLPDDIKKPYKLIGIEHAMYAIHSPKDEIEIGQAKFRLKFEELMMVQLELLMSKQMTQKKYKGHPMDRVGYYFNEFYDNHIPFELTNAQKRVIKEIRKDMGNGVQMNRLLQGDVGSGKTLVALMVMLIANGNDFQAAMMAPTEILAHQHWETLNEMCAKMDVRIELLTGSTKKAQRKELHEGLENGRINILIGTHALLEDAVKFRNLGLVVIDEQHRFGVAQRARLWKKNTIAPHILVMTATPIPRTLAMTLYGDLDVSVIDELPPGRKPIKTIHYFENNRLRMFGFIEEQIKLGHQVYIVYPLIEESEKLDLMNLQDGYEAICRRFQKPQYQVSVVHGRMKAEDKDHEMHLFAKGQTNIMVATTVIEVGVNVPNASVMVIENAERFGLSQLHQLRGRVGRGADQSFCILMSDYKISQDGKKRLETMVATNDGFEIAEVDLKLRGPGNMMGTQQSGMLDLKIADLAKDQAILAAARNAAMDLLRNDPALKKDEHRMIGATLMHRMKSRPNWSRVS